MEEAAAASRGEGGRGGKEWRSEETLDTTSDGLERQRKEGDLWWEKKKWAGGRKGDGGGIMSNDERCF